MCNYVTYQYLGLVLRKASVWGVFLNRYKRSIVRKADQMSFFFFTRFIFIFIQQAHEVAPPLYCFLLFLSASFDTFYYFLFQTFPYIVFICCLIFLLKILLIFQNMSAWEFGVNCLFQKEAISLVNPALMKMVVCPVLGQLF